MAAAMAITPAQLQQIVQDAVQAALTAQAQAAQPPAAPAFMINPAGAGNAAWDLTSSTGLKIYMSATAPIEPVYEGDEALMNAFLRKIWLRAQAFGFTAILSADDATGTSRNITKEFGCLTRAAVQAAAIADLRHNDRRTQAQELLRQMIQGSCAPKLVDRLEHRQEHYMVDIAQAGNAAEVKVSGSCMLFELTAMVSVQTRATVSSLMNKLDNLEDLMAMKKSNIREFNAEVETICDALRARRTQPPALLTKLFVGYSSCDDAVFCEYIKRKEEGYEDGTLTITEEELMSLALEKFKILHDDKKTWMKKTQQQLDFIAMQSQLNQLKQNPIKPKKAGGPPSDSSGSKDSNKERKPLDAKWAWKLTAPKAGEPTEKTFQGKIYIHCPHHETTQWVLKTNKKGLDHAAHCDAKEKSKDKPKNDGKAKALSNVMDDPDAKGGDSGDSDNESI